MFIKLSLCRIFVKKHNKIKKKKRTSKKYKSNKKIVLGIIVTAIILCCLYFLFKSKVAAIVDGEKIYDDRIESIYNSLPKETKMTKQQILQQLIDTKVFVNYIEKRGFILSDDEFNKELNLRLKESGLTADDFKKQLATSGASLEDVKDTFIIEAFVKSQVQSENQKQIVYQMIETQRKLSDIKILKIYE